MKRLLRLLGYVRPYWWQSLASVILMAGVGLLFHSTRYDAGLAVLIMMVGFLPLHIWDVFRERPAMGSKMLAWIRLPLQGVLIVWSWYVWRGF